MLAVSSSVLLHYALPTVRREPLVAALTAVCLIVVLLQVYISWRLARGGDA